MSKKLEEIKKPDGVGIEISVSLPMPERGRERKIPECRPEDKVEAAIELIESGHESREEWKFLRWVNNSLMDKHARGVINSRETKLLEYIQPIMEKYGQLDPEGVKQDASLHSTVTGNGRDRS